MAAHVKVLDTTLKSTSVKVTPGTYMTEVLEEACKKFGRNSTNFTLKNNKDKPLDLSLTFRQTGLSSGAKLELVAASRSPTVVTVALQLPAADGNTRLIDKFPSNTTLWHVLRHFEATDGKNLNFTGRAVAQIRNGASGAGRIVYETPELNVMGRTASTFTDLQKTLAQFGITSGSVALRLTFRPTDQPLEEAQAEINQYFQSLDGPAESSAPESSPAPVEPVSPPVLSDVTNAIDQMTTPSSGLERSPSPEDASRSSLKPLSPAKRRYSSEMDDDQPVIFRPPTSDKPRAAEEPWNEMDFEPSIQHAKAHQNLLGKASINKKLLSDAEEQRLEEEKAAKLSTVKQVTIRVRLPDQSQTMWNFDTSHTGLILYERVAKAIVSEDQPFKLIVPNSKGRPETIPKDDKKLLIKHVGLQGNVMATFHWEDSVPVEARKPPVLKSELLEKAKELPIPQVAAVESKQEELVDNDKNKGKGHEKEGSEGKKNKILGNIMGRLSKR